MQLKKNVAFLSLLLKSGENVKQGSTGDHCWGTFHCTQSTDPEKYVKGLGHHHQHCVQRGMLDMEGITQEWAHGGMVQWVGGRRACIGHCERKGTANGLTERYY